MKSFSIFLLLFCCLCFNNRTHAQVLNVCQGDSLRLSTATLSLPNAASVEWFRDNVLVSTDSAFVITLPGVYTLRCSGNTGCQSDFSAPLTVIVDTLQAVNDSVWTAPGTTVRIGVLMNDRSACYPIDTPTLVVTQQGTHGTATFVGDGIFKYEPEAGFTGIDTFYYVMNDVNGNPSNVAMVIVTIEAPVALGITLDRFEAIKVEDEAHLSWNTLNTINASHFEIERSSDAKNFEFKGKVLAPVNSTGNTDYNYWDKKPMAGKNYYRLKMISLDNRYEYSEVRLVNFNNDNTISLYPNPAKDYIIVDLGAAESDIPTVIVTDVIGKEITSKSVSGPTVSINLNNFAPGIYFIKLMDKNNTLKTGSYKFTKTN